MEFISGGTISSTDGISFGVEKPAVLTEEEKTIKEQAERKAAAGPYRSLAEQLAENAEAAEEAAREARKNPLPAALEEEDVAFLQSYAAERKAGLKRQREAVEKETREFQAAVLSREMKARSKQKQAAKAQAAQREAAFSFFGADPLAEAAGSSTSHKKPATDPAVKVLFVESDGTEPVARPTKKRMLHSSAGTAATQTHTRDGSPPPTTTPARIAAAPPAATVEADHSTRSPPEKGHPRTATSVATKRSDLIPSHKSAAQPLCLVEDSDSD